jgi:hypothetical protein
LRRLFSEINKVKDEVVFPVAAQSAGKSEAFLSYYLREKKGVLGQSIKLTPLPGMLRRLNSYKGHAHLICFDDVIGSGCSMIRALSADNPEKEVLLNGLESRTVKLTIIVSFASYEGLERIKKAFPIGVSVRAAHLIGPQDFVFSRESDVLPENENRTAFRQFCKDVGERIYDPANPFGWGAPDGWCLVFDYTVPNMTLPIIFQRGNETYEWEPLFPRSRTASPIAKVGSK